MALHEVRHEAGAGAEGHCAKRGPTGAEQEVRHED